MTRQFFNDLQATVDFFFLEIRLQDSIACVQLWQHGREIERYYD